MWTVLLAFFVQRETLFIVLSPRQRRICGWVNGNFLNNIALALSPPAFGCWKMFRVLPWENHYKTKAWAQHSTLVKIPSFFFFCFFLHLSSLVFIVFSKKIKVWERNWELISSSFAADLLGNNLCVDLTASQPAAALSPENIENNFMSLQHVQKMYQNY